MGRDCAISFRGKVRLISLILLAVNATVQSEDVSQYTMQTE